MRNIVILLVALAIGIAGYFVLRDDGVLEQVTAARVETALVANGVPGNLAECMAPRLADRLSIAQLRKLEAIAPHEGEGKVPASFDEARARIERIDDPEGTEQLVIVSARCAIGLIGG